MSLPRSDFAYELPPELIAQAPAERRDGSRLLRVGDGGLDDRLFAELPELLPPDAVLVINDTRVLPARLLARKSTGGAVEILLLERLGDEQGQERWRCLARASKPLRAGTALALEHPGRDGGAGPQLVVATDRGDDGTVEVLLPGESGPLLEAWGQLPLPPYIARQSGNTAADRERYQTVFAREPGAVAAPTAGLHFTDSLLSTIAARGVAIARVTLHVGLGTFAPVRVDDLDDHVMHEERFFISEATAQLLRSGRPVVAVGTTVVRALESAAGDGGAIATGWQATRLFIRPGHRFRVVDHLVTNFHLPESTLLVLVSAFAGHERVMNAYRHAVAARYRFFSYGDAMLLSRAEAPA